MPKATPLQPSFNAGELSPLIYGRVDSDRYKAGLAKCLNYIPTLQGPVVRRPGTKFVSAVKDSTKPPVMIPFMFSESQAYMMEFGDKYIRFYQGGGQVINPNAYFQVQIADLATNGLSTFNYTATRATLVPQAGEFISSSTSVSSGSTLELISPYANTEVSAIKWAQDADTLYLCHPNHQVYKMQRSSNYEWTLRPVKFKDGPYLPLNSYQSVGDSTAITIIPSTTTGFVTATTGPTFTISGIANNGSGICRVTTSAAHGYLSGQKVWIQGVAGTTEANNSTAAFSTTYWTITVIDTTHFDLIGVTFTHAWTSGGAVFPALFMPNPSVPGFFDLGRSVRLTAPTATSVWGYISSITDPAHFIVILSQETPALAGTTALTFWQLGTWRAQPQPALTTSFPSCVCFHQDRLCFSGAALDPQELDGSQPGDYENFAANSITTLQVTDSNAYQFNLNSTDLNLVRWLKSTAQGLLAGTQASEWMISPSNAAQALTPTNFNASQTSFFGSANIDPVQAGNATLHVQRASRKVREMNFFFQVGTFRSTDLTELSEHLTLPTVTKLVLQKETLPIVWALRSDGNFISMSYNRDDTTLKVGWSQHQLGGQADANGSNPFLYSAGVIPSVDTTFDQVWMVVQRYINGATVYTIEVLQKSFDDSFAQEDSYHFDCGITYDQPLNIGAMSISVGTTTVVTVGIAHGMSNGQSIRLNDIVGLSKTTTDIDGNSTTTNLLNGNVFTIGNVTTLTFQLFDSQGNAVVSTGYNSYVSGGTIRKMVTTITGLTWLKGETVGILTDGGIHPDLVVSSSGSITLNYPAAKVQIGYRYNSDGQLLRTEAGAADGTSIGKTRRVARVALMLHKVGGLLMGMSFNRLIPVEFQQADNQQADTLTPLFNGIHRDGVESAYDFDGQFCFRQNTGLPGMVQAIAVFLEEQDV